MDNNIDSNTSSSNKKKKGNIQEDESSEFGDSNSSLDGTDEQQFKSDSSFFIPPEISENIKQLLDSQFQTDLSEYLKLEKNYLEWKEVCINYASNFDTYVFKFSDILEKSNYLITKDKSIFTFPLNLQNRSEAYEDLISLKERLNKVSEENLESFLLSLPKSNIRVSSDYDIRYNDQDNKDPELAVLMKKSVYTISILLKILVQQQKQIKNILLGLCRADQQLAKINPEIIVEILKEANINSDNTQAVYRELISSLGKLEISTIIEALYKKVKEIKVISGDEMMFGEIQKDLIRNLETGLFRILNELLKSKDFFLNDIENTSNDISIDRNFINNWLSIYDKLVELTSDFLSEHMDIEVIQVNKGDDFDDIIHNPIDTESDSELKSGQILSVENNGFERKGRLLKAVDVIVVKN